MFEPTRHTLPKAGRRRNDWWRGAVIYQIYPRSFQDSNGDGVGDLPGISHRLGHIASLGVDAIWISPFMKSPMKDYGYDVADYREVDPLFGTLQDFDHLVRRAHELGLEVLIDFVPSHTSDRHAWFLDSRQGRTGHRADWYVWADARPDGTPPNNWLSVFGGPAWAWSSTRRQYYLHNFLKEQPDLNFHNPEVIAALMAEAEFWLERGVDGFRIDAIDFGVHDPLLRDNPPRPPAADGNTADLAGSPFGMQYQLYNKARPELADLFFKPLHALTERHGGKLLLGEISGDRALQRMAEYSDGGGLDVAYTFDLLTCPPEPRAIREIVEAVEREVGGGWACWAFSNHDVQRAVTRFAAGREPSLALRKLVPTLLCTLRGTVCLYQGEELGLEEAELRFEDLRDPFGKAFWPEFKGRDGCRTPMPWAGSAAHGGFTSGEPWLPLSPRHLPLAVDLQEGDPDSVLNHVRAFLGWRRAEPALARGDIRFMAGEAERRGVLICLRELGNRRLFCAFNLSAATQRFAATPHRLDAIEFAAAAAAIENDQVTLPAWGWLFASVQGEA
jgi:alpha-glucosidase